MGWNWLADCDWNVLGSVRQEPARYVVHFSCPLSQEKKEIRSETIDGSI